MSSVQLALAHPRAANEGATAFRARETQELPGTGMVDDYEDTRIARPTQEDESVEHLLQSLGLRTLLANDDVQELVINRPGEALVETSQGWRVVPSDAITASAVMYLANAVATWSQQQISEQRPILGATLASGERCQFVVPPAVEAGSISVTIRKPSTKVWRLNEFEAQGAFAEAHLLCDSSSDVEAARTNGIQVDTDSLALLKLLWSNDVAGFCREVVTRHKTVIVSGATGSGKTTFMKAAMQECDPLERIVTIEDAREIFLPRHRKKVHLMYSKGGQGVSNTTAQSLLVSCLRMRPDRILLAEIREGEAFDFLRTAASGHPGSISSMHAGNPAEAFEQMALMVKQSPAGSGLNHGEIKRLLVLSVDVIVQYTRDKCAEGKTRRRVSHVYFRPVKKAREAHV